MYTYVQWPGCKKENTATYVYIRVGSQTPTRAYVRPGLVYMAGSERRNNVVVVFMGRQRNASCSWGANRLGRNGMRRRVHREGLDGTGDGNEAWRTAKRRKRPCVRLATVETGSYSSGGVWHTTKRRKLTSYSGNGILLIRMGVAFRKMEETDLCWSATVETGVLFIGRGVAYRKTEEADLLRLERGSC